MSSDRSPRLSPAQLKAANQSHPPVPKVCVVTGGTGFVGQRLVEMLVERGAEKVISFDIVPKPAAAWDHPKIEWRVGDVADREAVFAVCKGADCVWHNAAAVGPFHPQELYDKVNFHGTENVIAGCKKHGVPKLVFSSSPSTRFDGSDVDGLRESDMPQLPLKSYMQEYAGSKARGEMAVTAACCDELLTTSIAPHQVYGPRDNLFLPNILEAAGDGKLRKFAHPRTGYGKNKVCFTHVDNYTHALIIGERALYKGSPALGNFYVTTDGDTHPHPGYCYFWDEVDRAVVAMGFTALADKYPLPYWFMMIIAYICDVIGFILNMKLKINPFNVKVLVMHRWFIIDHAETDLKFKPIIGFEEGWEDTIAWFKANWLPGFHTSHRGLFQLAKQSEDKIDIQDGKKVR